MHLPRENSEAWKNLEVLPSGCDGESHFFTPPPVRLRMALACACGATNIIATPSEDGGWDIEAVDDD